jgi:hypothetical protein
MGEKQTVRDHTSYGSPIYDMISYIASSALEEMEDEDAPGFFRKRNKGEIVVNPMLQFKYERQDEFAAWDWKGTSNGDPSNPYYKGTYKFIPDPRVFTNPLPLSLDARDSFFQKWETARGQAILKAWANVDESEILAYATIGELPETVKWIASLYQRFVVILKVFTSKRVKLEAKRFMNTDVDTMSYVDALSNFWLEMRYAVRPLIFEMEQIVNALKASAVPPRRTARGRVDEQVTEMVNYSYVPRSYTVASVVGVTNEIDLYRAGVLYNVDLESGSWAHVVALDQPLETMWELTRLSFLVDWFLNIGTLLSAHTPNAGLTPLCSWVVETHEYSWDLQMEGKFDDTVRISGWTFTNMNSSPGFSKGRWQVKRRVVNPPLPYFPSVSVNLDWAKTLDIATIARGLYRSLR